MIATCLRRPLLPAVLVALLLAGPAAADYAWIEGEAVAKRPDGFKVGGWGNQHSLPGGSWLFAGIDGKAAAALPADGVLLDFPFEIKSGGSQEVWARVGYEGVR